MNWKSVFPLILLLFPFAAGAFPGTAEKQFSLEDIRTMIQQNRSVIVENLDRQSASENLLESKSRSLPDLMLGGDGYYSNTVPLASDAKSSNSLLYHFSLSAEFDVYTGGMHKREIERMTQEQRLSEERLKAVEQEVELQAIILLYDIHRNIKYQDFIQSSIRLREKEYERILQLYDNGLVLKSDLLRSKLYITDLQKDEIAIRNSIDILSEELCTLLGMEERFLVRPVLENDLGYAVEGSFEDLYQSALAHSPYLSMQQIRQSKEETVLKELKSAQLPDVKVYARYGAGSAAPISSWDHQLGGEVGAKLSLNISSFYKSRHRQFAQKQRIERERVILEDERENLRNTLYELFTRYNESLLNIDRALAKIEMSDESSRILHNSYFNQQALLIDVLESETKSMEASFEWVEAVVDSQKYYWALKKTIGTL